MNTTLLIERVKAILLNPKATWEIIKEEGTTVSGIYRGYLVPLAAIPAAAMLIGRCLIGVSYGFAGHFREPLGRGVTGAVLGYVMTLAGILVAGKVIEALAPNFSATKNGLNAFKVAAYSWTPALVAGIVGIVPTLAPLGLIAGLYGIYLLYLGLLVLMACPAEKAVGYTIASVVVMILIAALIMGIVGAVTRGPGVGIVGMRCWVTRC